MYGHVSGSVYGTQRSQTLGPLVTGGYKCWKQNPGLPQESCILKTPEPTFCYHIPVSLNILIASYPVSKMVEGTCSKQTQEKKAKTGRESQF